MSKIQTVILVIAYSFVLIRYLQVTLKGSDPDVIELNYVFRPPGNFLKLMKNLRQMGNNLSTFIMITNMNEERLPTDLKYILKWTDSYRPFLDQKLFKNSQGVFYENNCKYQNCFLTNSKSLLIDPSYFDAILFDAENTWDRVPPIRSLHQLYIFTASESASKFPVCYPISESFYNLTWTYRLDSDIKLPYMTILDHDGKVIGPNVNIKWTSSMEPTSETVKRRLVHKRRAAAWFVSHCTAPSKRERVAKNIIEALDQYKLTVDTYGWCGKMTCPKERMDECLDLLEQDYYFYFAFEDSLSEDYVTENLLYPLMHFTVPIVYGGANYSRFIPPGSYIDAKELNASEVAFLMNEAIKNPSVYHDYFRWHNYYEYKGKSAADICDICRVLNTKKDRTVKHNFRYWWNPNYEEDCKEKFDGLPDLTKE